MDPHLALDRAIKRGHRAALVTVTDVVGDPPTRPGVCIAVLDDGSTYGSLGCDGFDRSGAADASIAMESGDAFDNIYPWDEQMKALVTVQPYSPGDVLPARSVQILELLVVGVGPVARALVGLGEAMGYHVRVAAGPRSPSVGEFDGADEVIVTPTYKDVEALRPGANTFVVICGHDEEFSQPVLRALLPTPVPYLGMMGSGRHTGHLLSELKEAGFDAKQISKVHSPVGLPIGSETPEEIAVSVLAEIVRIRRLGDN
ncbi:MAG: XdhC family protein [Actinomycetota bacterium]|nr:XdhC/CoxI family protein [Actinomycetota bacterium]